MIKGVWHHDVYVVHCSEYAHNASVWQQYNIVYVSVKLDTA